MTSPPLAFRSAFFAMRSGLGQSSSLASTVRSGVLRAKWTMLTILQDGSEHSRDNAGPF